MAERKAIIILNSETESKTIIGIQETCEFLGVSRRTLHLHLQSETPVNGWYVMYHPDSPEHTGRPSNLYRVSNLFTEKILNGRREVAEFIGASDQTVYTLSKTGRKSKSGWKVQKIADRHDNERRLYA